MFKKGWEAQGGDISDLKVAPTPFGNYQHLLEK